MLRWFFALMLTMALFAMLTPSTAHACTVTPTPMPTATPDANGYIPPTQTPYPTRTPIPVPTRVAQMATRSAVVVEGHVADAEQYATPRYYDPQETAAFEIDRYYSGSGGSNLTFTYYVVPCPGEKPRFADSPQGVFFFSEDNEGRLYYDGHLPADDKTLQSLALTVGPGRQPRDFSMLIVPIVVVLLAGAVGLFTSVNSIHVVLMFTFGVQCYSVVMCNFVNSNLVL